ncbi:Beclin-1 [Labeo rohita]|uniref:Beclin-1 n=1 Tax=Labeo rohita TaxID=84645 RepID=A0ABQ8M6U9_LABRO|nr:Beclin-1 [Labeo rohita]
MEGLKFSSNTMQVSFVCQRCSQPLKLDTSFNVLDRMTIHELTAPLLTVTANKQSESSEGSRFPEVSLSHRQAFFVILLALMCTYAFPWKQELVWMQRLLW